MAVAINDPSITWAVYQVGPYPSFPDHRPTLATPFAMNAGSSWRSKVSDCSTCGAGEYDVVLNAFVNGVGGGAEKDAASLPDGRRASHRPPAIAGIRFPIVQIELSKVGTDSDAEAEPPGW